jgi:rsbT co-antagonist protein RsbR
MLAVRDVYRTIAASSLLRRLIALLLVVGLLPALLVCVLGAVSAAQALEHQIGGRLDDLAAATLDQIDRVVLESSRDVQTFATLEQAGTLDSAVLTPLVSQLARTHSSRYAVIMVVDKQGTVRAINTNNTYASQLSSRFFADQDWFRVWFDQPLPAGQSYISDLFVDPSIATSSGSPGRMLAVSYPVRDQGGDIIGVWSVFVDWKAVQRLVDESLVPARADAPGLAFRLINNDGLVLISPDDSAILTARIPLDGDQYQAIQQRALTTRGRGWIAPTLLAGASISHDDPSYRGRGWIAIATRDRGEALAPVQSIWMTLLLGLLVAAGIVALGLAAGYRAARPILALNNLVARAVDGDLDQPAPAAKADEIGQLGAGFNYMIAQIKDSQELFESRIAARTSDLQNTLSILRNTLDQRDQLNEQLRESSVPLIPLIQGIAVLPVVGVLDSGRIAQLQQNVLDGIEGQRLRVALVDITAVPVVDTQVALGLIMTARAAQLMGCRVGLVGIRPEVAQTLVQLGVAFDNMTTHASLQEGLLTTLQEVGYRVVQQSQLNHFGNHET